ncbi:MAG: methyltransferase domain-containing protein [Actinobacteria bacterium]|nr:methyltransferase domain-containing protein [Actinomycetota bacterium]MCA1721265.1 methyltransferase domain-containing protein [Actinomycetota bacterium]
MTGQPGSPTAFEALVDVYDAARPRYPAELYDALPSLGGRVLELGAGTGIATRELERRAGLLVSTDLGPKMLGRLHELSPDVPAAVCRSEALPFADASFDVVCGAQMWHWVDPSIAAPEVARVLRPGGTLALWWNEVDADGLPWWDAQQDRLEAGNPRYSRGYRDRDYGAELAPYFSSITSWTTSWERVLDWPTYEMWLRSKSYVQALDDVGAFVAAEQQSLTEAFPDGRIVEPFRVSLWKATT